MDLSNSQHEECDKETKDLQGLFDAFASVCSLEEIASAYCSVKGDVDAAGLILVGLQNSRNGHDANNAHVGGATCSSVKESDEDGKALFVLKKSWSSKQKKFTVSTGIVSDALGKGCVLPRQSRVRCLKADEPLKPEVKQMCPSVTSNSDVQAQSKPPNSKDIENFLFSMLHDGFNLDKEMAQNVLRSCGHDAKKSIKELLELSSLNPVEGKEIVSMETSTGIGPGENLHLLENRTQLAGSEREVDGSCLGERPDACLMVLEALYRNSKVSHEEPKRTRFELGLNRRRVPREKVVSAPPVDTEVKTTDVKASIETEDDTGKYKILREAAKSHWDMTKTYYESAFNAFISGDYEKANHLLEKGKHHNRFAREADEKSSREIIATRSMDKDIFSLDLQMHRTMEAVTLLKQHLCSLAGISTISHLKVIVDSDAVDVTKGRRKQAVIKFLEKHSIIWTVEEGKPGTILIQMDLIDPKKLILKRK